MRLVFRSLLLVYLLFSSVGCRFDRTAEKPAVRLDTQLELARMFSLMYDRNDTLPEEYPEMFERRLEEILHDPATADMSFDSLRAAGMGVVASDDGRMKIFHWFHPGSGQAWRVPAVVQVRGGGQIVVRNLREGDRANGEYWYYENSPGIDYAGLYRLTDSLWLAIGAGQVDGMLKWINAFGLQLKSGSEIVSGIPLFERGNDSLESEVNLPLMWYDFHPDREGNIIYPAIHFDPQKREISFPVMARPGRDTLWLEEPTGDRIRLRFNGWFFEEI